MAISLQARVVCPVDRPPIEHGVVTIDRERIVAVGTAADSGAAVRDLGQVALLPGLVNAHAHLEFSHLPRPLGEAGMRLVNWIRLVIAERQGRIRTPADAIAAGLRESAASGVTTIGEIAANGWSGLNDSETADGPLPLHMVLFLEVIGFSRVRAASALAAVEERLADMRTCLLAPSRTGHLSDQSIRDQSISGQSIADQASIQLGLSPHAPYTVSPDLLRQLVALARRRDLPVAMHLAESADELDLLSAGTGPLQELLDERSMWDAGVIPHASRPLDYLKMQAEAPRALVIHGTYLDAEARSFLAARADRMSLVYCPRTHAYFKHAPYPLGELLAAGVRVALGTDSRASNPDLDLLAEMRFIARAHPNVSPHDNLRMGTLAGAEALGRGKETGSLTPGKLADLVAVPLPDDARGAPEELLAVLLAAAERPCAVWLRGHEYTPQTDRGRERSDVEGSGGVY